MLGVVLVLELKTQPIKRPEAETLQVRPKSELDELNSVATE
jgi:hypothetical protein